MEYITREPCGQDGCRETRFYLDNGLWFCRRGHQQLGRQVEEDPDDFGTQGKTNRVKKPVVEKAQKKYRGRQAHRLYLHIYQLILFKQCHALVNERGFPPQLQNVVRDLWALRLGAYASKIADPADEDSQPEYFSSQPTSAREDTDTEGLKARGKAVQWPRLIDTLGLCYLATLLMRLPVRIADFHRLATRNDIPYYRVLNIIPRDMKEKLPQQYMALFETTSLLKCEDLHTAVYDLVSYYRRQFEMQFPPLNAPALLYRLIRRLALPVDVYPATKTLQTLLGYTLEYPSRVSGKRKHLDMPELQLVTLVVIATKLLFPFDGLQRHPTSTQEPAAQAINWKAWAELQQSFNKRDAAAGRIGKGEEIFVIDTDVPTMNTKQLDEYMDWYESSWLDTSKEPGPLDSLFPLSSATRETRPGTSTEEDNVEDAIDAMLKKTSNFLQSRPVIGDTDEDIPRPGSHYARYRTKSELPHSARVFYKIAAKVTGVPLQTLLHCVNQAEVQILKKWHEQRRIEHFAEHSMVELEDSDIDEDMEPESEDSDLDIDEDMAKLRKQKDIGRNNE
ncbi:hypothetical protein BJY00DRAFT_77699 [Aspergillus carlsbadensis]|nr:hypothetical protein BJY00DRAFT_77699 [Aspergillus carlsbadensis]